ncbi:hypothetical protein EHS13_20235 [Paenibacillus psychroresistens]|uniref:Uncharacterized protein n=1 Tax=Paenibacillus psychroresistens TaxID=1778678 RepID=A0A6B8RP02_9BACL|nr:hypothetical protein [Paenibacillus psychroresistens]QGQ97048.1 hypothetical protein EHS13_20235 [Paenibacillus psychroresistens]
MTQLYADSDSNGNILGFYADDVHTPEQIPETAIEITHEEWQSCLEYPGKWIVVNGALALDLVNYPPPYVEPEPLPPTPEQLRIAQLEEENETIKADGLMTMEAIAEVYEMILNMQGGE